MLTAGVAITCLTIGLVFTTGAGEYWLTLFDSFGATGLTFIAFTELVSVMYVHVWSPEVHPGHHDHDRGEAGDVLADHMEVSTPDNDSDDDDDDVQVRVPGPDGWNHPQQSLLHDVTLAHLHRLGPGHGHRCSTSDHCDSLIINDRSPCSLPLLDHGGGRHPRHLQPGAHHLRPGESKSQ